MIWDIDGIDVGHWQDETARTGCTVVRCDPPAVASGEVRGSAPATREFDLLDPLATVERIDAVVLSGGSAFGLAAAQGVVEWCEGRDRGVPTSAGRVPIVVGMSLFDLATGDPSVRPGPAEGRAAAEAAPSTSLGPVGAGCGATSGSWRGEDEVRRSGLGGAVVRAGELVVAALMAANPWGDILDDGPPRPAPDPWPGSPLAVRAGGAVTNTTIGVVATNARLDPLGCRRVVRGAHDGLARAITPPHSGVDGDAVVVLATGAVAAPVDQVQLMALDAVDRAIRSAAAPR